MSVFGLNLCIEKRRPWQSGQATALFRDSSSAGPERVVPESTAMVPFPEQRGQGPNVFSSDLLSPASPFSQSPLRFTIMSLFLHLSALLFLECV